MKCFDVDSLLFTLQFPIRRRASATVRSSTLWTRLIIYREFTMSGIHHICVSLSSSRRRAVKSFNLLFLTSRGKYITTWNQHFSSLNRSDAVILINDLFCVSVQRSNRTVFWFDISCHHTSTWIESQSHPVDNIHS